jgi:branched-chain amino acid transport system substrate-binding protein
MNKNFTAIFRIGMVASMAAMIVFALVGCRAEQSTQSRDQPQQSNDQSRQIETIRIGAIIPLSGDNAQYGKWIQEALELYKDEVNAAGGIRGAKLSIIYEDDQADPKMAVSAMNKLVNVDKVPVVYGSWASSSVLAEAPIAERSKTIVMAQGISPKIREAGDYIFRCIPSSEHSLARLVPFARSKGAQEAAILYVNNDYGLDQAQTFAKLFTNLGGHVVFQEGYGVGQTDFRSILTKIKSLNVDSIYLPGYSEVGTILKQATELGIKAQYYASDPFENPDIVKLAGAAANGVFYPFFFNPDQDLSALKNFEQRYTEKYGRNPEGTAALAYNGLQVLVEAIKVAGFDPAKIKDALYGVHNFEGIMGSIAIDDHGDMRLPIYIKTVQNGDFVFVVAQ